MGYNKSLNFHAFVILCYIAAWVFETLIVYPVQNFFGLSNSIVCVLFLPHGVRVLATWLSGPWAMVTLTFAELLSTGWHVGFTKLSSTHFVSSLIGGSCAYIAFRLFKLFGIGTSIEAQGIKLWRVLIFVAVIASLINSIGKTYIYSANVSPLDAVGSIGAYLLGDTLGAVLCMFLLLLFFRKFELKTGTTHP